MGNDLPPAPGKLDIRATAAIVLMLVIVPAVVLGRQRGGAGELRSDANHIRAIGSAFVKYLEEAPDRLAPRLSSIPGVLTFDDDTMSSILDGAYEGSQGGNDSEPNPGDAQMIYLGYMLEDTEDLDALATYYVSHAPNGGPLEDAIPLPKTRPDGRNALLRIQILKELPEGSAWSAWYKDPAIIPVFIERRRVHHDEGAYVIFLDGHAAFYPSGRSNVWPMDRHDLGAIARMDDLQP